MNTRRLRLLGAGLTVGGMVMGGVPVIASEDAPVIRLGECASPEGVPVFEQHYVDTTRAGGEPIIETLPDGTLVWGSHAGTTHVYGVEAADENVQAFLQNYNGQTYYYWSDDNGESWTFVPRDPVRDQVDSGLPVSGFSDPEFAVDLAGNVYVSEINLANIAVSKSEDSGRSYTLQSLVEITASDRQWMEADEENVLYFVANTFAGGSTSSGNPVTGSTGNAFYKSVDGGQTFSAPQEFIGGQASSDIHVDKSDGRVYQLNTGGATLQLMVLPNARNEMPPNMTVETYDIAFEYARASTIDPTLAVGPEGNLYVSWAGTYAGEQGVWYTYSTDRGETWLEDPIKVSDGEETAIWSWIKVGDKGNVSITWLEADKALDGHEQENGTGPWHVWTAITQNGLGCDDSEIPGFVVTRASIEAPHTGQICSTGTTCEARAVDRRLGDYFSHTIDADGNTVVAISDTNMGGPVSLPLVVRQVDGPTLRSGGGDTLAMNGTALLDGAAPSVAATPEVDAAPAAVAPTSEDGPSLPATGGGMALAGLGLVTFALGLRRR